MRRRSFLGLAATGVLAPTAAQAEAPARTGWVNTWTSMPQQAEPHRR
jgi:hypothetical protein